MLKKHFSIILFIVFVLLIVVSFQISRAIYEEQSSAYIDEIFHIPQAQSYCMGNWSEWNPKITTFPGLYITSYLLLKPLDFLGFNKFCSLCALRSTNIIATAANFILAFKIISAIEDIQNVKSHNFLKLLSALNISILPPLYFFTFLYYTDVWSTTFVLLMYYFHLSNRKHSKVLAGFSSFMSVLMRQTNIVWVGLLIIDKTWTNLCKDAKAKVVRDYPQAKKVLQRIFYSYFKTREKDFKDFMRLICDIVLSISQYFIVCLGFVSFVIYNGSIVVGDKSAHTATLHPMQNLYYVNFAIFFGAPFALLELKSLWKKPPNSLLIVLLLCFFAALSEINKLEHPYLLADNRHLAFYAWKKLFGHPMFRRLLIPTYIVCGIIYFRLLQKKTSLIFSVAVALCTFINLTPQYLFEFRYFIVPFIMWRLQLKQHPVVILETIFFAAVNFLVLRLFLTKTFIWPNEPDVKQRFIW